VTHPKASGARGTLLVALQAVSAVAAAFFAGAILRDPYTSRLDGGDVMLPAPWWHLALAYSDCALLAVFAFCAWRRTPRRALVLLLGETLLHVLTTLAYVEHDGSSRFVFGFAAQSMLAPWLAFVAARVLLAPCWAMAIPAAAHPAGSRAAVEPEPPAAPAT
jgi:hypothetical protein